MCANGSLGYYDRISGSLVIECIIKYGSYTKPAGYLDFHLLSVMKEVSKIHTNVYTYIHTYTHTHTHTHTYIYIYIHTYIHTYI